ncbi:Conserved hypothetical protein CHP02231, partial [Aphelenchoides avenae]
DSSVFPRLTLCDVPIRGLGDSPPYMLQCHLRVKTWLFAFVAVSTACSFAYYALAFLWTWTREDIVRFLVRSKRHRVILNSPKKSDEEVVKIFANDGMQTDGTLLFWFIQGELKILMRSLTRSSLLPGVRTGSGFEVEEEPTKFNEMRVQKHALSSTFKVPQKTSIPGDSSEHKVTIARLEFELLVGLECFPYVTTDVFETATALNNSNYPLLRGPAAVYLGQNFTSDTAIHAAAIGEKFVVALGVDSGVKVKYTSAEPFHEQSDDKKTSMSLVDKKIHVKNLKAKEKTLITIHQQVPKSTDSKIKVGLLTPAKSELIAADDASTLKPIAIGPHLGGDNILDWTVELNAGKERDLVAKWSVQSPADETVEYYNQGRAADRSNE